MRIERINNGIVLDHISAGVGIEILNLFPTEILNTKIDYASYIDSPRQETKDIIKIENLDVEPKTLMKMALLSPNITISIIRNGQVSKKIRPTIPDQVDGVVACTNPKCVTLREDYLESKIRLFKQEDSRLRKQCVYCEHTFF